MIERCLKELKIGHNGTFSGRKVSPTGHMKVPKNVEKHLADSFLLSTEQKRRVMGLPINSVTGRITAINRNLKLLKIVDEKGNLVHLRVDPNQKHVMK